MRSLREERGDMEGEREITKNKKPATYEAWVLFSWIRLEKIYQKKIIGRRNLYIQAV